MLGQAEGVVPMSPEDAAKVEKLPREKILEIAKI